RRSWRRIRPCALDTWMRDRRLMPQRTPRCPSPRGAGRRRCESDPRSAPSVRRARAALDGLANLVPEAEREARLGDDEQRPDEEAQQVVEERGLSALEEVAHEL